MMPFVILILIVIFLLLLIMRLKVPAFIALVLVSILVGLAYGMPLPEVMKSIQDGTGSTLGYLALVLGMGAMFGGLIADSGAALQITNKMVGIFGEKGIQWAMVATGFIIGIPMFYTVGFVMMVPLAFAIAKTTKLPLLYLAVPMIAALSVTHGFLPPHPAPTSLAVIYGADMSLTFLYGIGLAIPTIIIAGPLFARTLKNIKASIPDQLFNINEIDDRSPSFLASILTAIVPLVLMAVSALIKLSVGVKNGVSYFFNFLGEPVVALLVALLIAIYTLGIKSGRSLADIATIFGNATKGIAMILLIIGAGGGFKQILIDSGISVQITDALRGTGSSPILIAWSIAAALRVALGSATVAALTAAGIAVPLVASTGASPEILVLATGAGSLTFSQVNDTGFWLFKEYFNLSITDTFRSWTAMETIISIIGLLGCLLLDKVL